MPNSISCGSPGARRHAGTQPSHAHGLACMKVWSGPSRVAFAAEATCSRLPAPSGATCPSHQVGHGPGSPRVERRQGPGHLHRAGLSVLQRPTGREGAPHLPGTSRPMPWGCGQCPASSALRGAAVLPGARSASSLPHLPSLPPTSGGTRQEHVESLLGGGRRRPTRALRDGNCPSESRRGGCTRKELLKRRRGSGELRGVPTSLAHLQGAA